MTGPEYLERIAQILLQHGVVSRITEKMMHTASEDLHRHTTNPYLQRQVSPACLLEALTPLLADTPDHLVWFDAEMDTTTYVDLVQYFAAATNGEWSPEQVVQDVIADTNTRDFYLTLDLDVHGNAVHGEWTTSSLKWVAEGFLDLIESIETHLSGAFVAIPTHDQTMLFAYLPHSCVQNVQTLLDQLEQEYSDFMTFARIF